MPLTKVVSQGLQGSPRVSIYTITGPAAYATGGFAADITTEAMGSIDLTKATVSVVPSTLSVDCQVAAYDPILKNIKAGGALGEVAALTDLSGVSFVITAYSTP
tara:strand:- start:14 stop:325 length:312 start_codon:yes stop_codon:yes gene_type:complete